MVIRGCQVRGLPPGNSKSDRIGQRNPISGLQAPRFEKDTAAQALNHSDWKIAHSLEHLVCLLFTVCTVDSIIHLEEIDLMDEDPDSFLRRLTK